MNKKTRFIITSFIFFLSLNLAAAKDLYGFRLEKSEKYTPGNQVFLYEHQKSGAHVVWLKNDDTNRAFNIAFQTRAYDDVGLPHIFEHACLAGSTKYPDSNLFNQMGSQTYNTYMNAATFQNFTCYPMSSLSEDQLFASLDVYINGIFDPLVLTEENDLKREAVRLVLRTPDEEITATGAVYNELLGVMSDKNSMNYYALKKLLFPGSTDAAITGGNPSDILNVTWQSVKDFHKKYYLPSNMVIFLYGKLDIERFLKYFDSAFLCNYERSQPDLNDDLYSPYEGCHEEVLEFPVTADSNTKNASIFNYAMTLDGADYQTYNDLRIFENYICQESSWLTLTIKERFPSANYYCYFQNSLRHPYYVFSVENINEEDKDELKEIFQQAVEAFCAEKIDKKYIDVFAKGLKMSVILDQEDPDGISELRSAAVFWSVTGNPLEALNAYKALMQLPKTSSPESVLATVKKFLLAPKQSAILITKPVAGLAEKNSAKEKAFFAEKKNAMSKEEIARLIQENADYDKWLSDNEKKNLLDKVKVIGLENLPEESQDVDISDSRENGVRELTGEIKGLQYVNMSLYFNLQTLPAPYLHPVMLYFSLLESLETEKHSLSELETICMENLYSSSFYTTYFNLKDQLESGATGIYSVASLSCLNEKLSESLKYIEEVLLNTKLSDFNTIRSFAGRMAISKKENLTNNPAALASDLAFTALHPAYTDRYFTLKNDYWAFLEKVSKMNDEEVSSLTDDIKKGLSYVFNRNNLVFTCIGDKKQIEKCRKFQKNLCQKLSSEVLEKQNIFTPHKKTLPKSIAVIIPGNSCYDYKAISLESLGIKYNAKYESLVSLLSEAHLFSTIRYKYGAYGAGSWISDNGLYLYSYRDPHIKNTYQIFDSSSKALKEKNISVKNLEGYITSIYSELAKKASTTSLMSSKISRYLAGDYENNKSLRYMKELKSTEEKDIDDFIKMLEILEKDGVKVTAGAAGKIRENSSMFDLIIDDFIK